MANELGDPHTLFFHVRMVMGMVIGLALAHLLRGVARVIEHPGDRALYWVHLLWVFFMFMYLVHFWWWELWFSTQTHWTFGIYFFLVLYSLLLYLLAALVFPEHLTDYSSYRDYFYSRRVWIFGVLALVFVVDFPDTWLKGKEYVERLGPEYPIRNMGFIVLSIAAMATRNATFHAVFAVAAIVYQLSWIVRLYDVLG
ncbi:hypothetical protein HNQ60_004152 [Povalibacter uvarum]|uniref:Uncharacterized protein n=1 Tax=Povalibacter uvarum TaxID=732238 RepID=A0A841HTE3_9GAMM|nr:hypothetical protein [Povalibacter uvarum]MBB6095262.1 hypothetical protein [Povalibacter uvarum]